MSGYNIHRQPLVHHTWSAWKMDRMVEDLVIVINSSVLPVDILEMPALGTPTPSQSKVSWTSLIGMTQATLRPWASVIVFQTLRRLPKCSIHSLQEHNLSMPKVFNFEPTFLQVNSALAYDFQGAKLTDIEICAEKGWVPLQLRWQPAMFDHNFLQALVSLVSLPRPTHLFRRGLFFWF